METTLANIFRQIGGSCVLTTGQFYMIILGFSLLLQSSAVSLGFLFDSPYLFLLASFPIWFPD
jgi:hypothetical protein